MKDFQHD